MIWNWSPNPWRCLVPPTFTMTEESSDFLTLIYSLKPSTNELKLYTDFAALPGRWFLYGVHLYKDLCALVQLKEKPKTTVTGSVRIPSLIFTLLCFSFFCLFDLQIKSEIQKLANFISLLLILSSFLTSLPAGSSLGIGDFLTLSGTGWILLGWC